MDGFETREQASAVAGECGGDVCGAWDGTWYVVGARAPGLGRWLAGDGWSGYERDLDPRALAYLTGGPDAAEAAS